MAKNMFTQDGSLALDIGFALRNARAAGNGRADDETMAANVERMAMRYEAGEDLWTGEPLQDVDASQWLKLQTAQADYERCHADEDEGE